MLVWDLSKPLPYDFNDPDSQFSMFSRRLSGYFLLPFSKQMVPGYGTAEINGKPVPCTVQPVYLGGDETWWFGVKLGGCLHDYNAKVSVKVSGFRDTDGNEMIPAVFEVETPKKVLPDPVDQAHDAVALQAAQDGIVLLKNENTALPLTGGGTLNFFGSGIYEFRLCAFGAGKILPRYAVGLLEAARNESGWHINRELAEFYAQGENKLPDEDMLERACQQSDTAIVVITRAAGENADSCTDPGEYYLTKAEDDLLAALRKKFRKLIVLLNVGYPISTAFSDKVDALVYNGFGGMLAGPALMDVLTGRVNPSGKLPDTWSENYNSIPSAKNFYDCAGGKHRIVSDDKIWLNTVYQEDIFMGYRYFESVPDADRSGYPFGYGLSYTSFSIHINNCTFDGNVLYVRASVQNTGASAGREVVQLYLSKPQGKLEQPARELIGFQKTAMLAPGESQFISLSIPLRRMTSYDEDLAAYVAVPGTYTVFLGGNVRDAKAAGSFVLTEQQIVQQVKSRMKPNLPLDTPSGVLENASGITPERKNVEHFSHSLLPKPKRTLSFRDVLMDESLLSEFVGGMDVKALARIAICADHGWGMEGRGEAGRLSLVDGLELPAFIVADGNSGVNLQDRNIGMPSGATLCASFDCELMEAVGRVIGEEAKALGIHLILAPGMNLHRNPLCGRQPEYFSEDPFLAGSMAGHYCRGLESTGIGGCYKHFAANNAESGRKRNQSIISERALRELYLRAFAYAMEEYEPVSVMTAYNAINGLFTSCDPELIQGVLFEEWGFRGFVMTDWTSYDSADVVEMAAAGNCWITPGSQDDTFTRQLEDAVADGRLSLEQLQENVLRIIRVLVKLNRSAK